MIHNNKFNILSCDSDTQSNASSTDLADKNKLYEYVDKSDTYFNRSNSYAGKWKNNYNKPLRQTMEQLGNNKITHTNLNKLLCRHMLSKGQCDHGDSCSYAHTLDEQNVDYSRHRAYDIIKGTHNLSHIDLKKDYALYKTFIVLTNICDMCLKKECEGGYNCKYGVCSEKYAICITDLKSGNCVNLCKKIHLTSRGLKAYEQIRNDHESKSSFDGLYKSVSNISRKYDNHTPNSIKELLDKINNTPIIDFQLNNLLKQEKSNDVTLNKTSDSPDNISNDILINIPTNKSNVKLNNLMSDKLNDKDDINGIMLSLEFFKKLNMYTEKYDKSDNDDISLSSSSDDELIDECYVSIFQ